MNASHALNLPPLSSLPSEPCYVLQEELLRRNLSLIKEVSERAGVEIILAFKAFALWRTFPIFREYIASSTASSEYEAQLGFHEMGAPVHTFSPAYTDENIAIFRTLSSHITFNSLSQWQRFYTPSAHNRLGGAVSSGLRINPEYSPVATDLYNPALPGSRFGVTADELQEAWAHLTGLEGLHVHVLCEGDSYQLEQLLTILESRFDFALQQVRWLNLGGGHLMTRKDYDVEHLIRVLQSFKARYPHLHIIMEPGSAFAWQTGYLRSHVVDIVSHHGVTTAILDVSFTCHMPDCLEMPYKPVVRGAYQDPVEGLPTYTLGGCSCLSGDYIGSWSFQKPLQIGDEIIFEDMIHYTTVKTHMFNGISHPSLVWEHQGGGYALLRQYGYEDYKGRMD